MDPMVSMYISQGIHGIAYGMILFLIASGLNIIFGMMGILNMAHTAFFMLAAYFCYVVVGITGNFWLGLLFAPLFTAVLGVVMERVFLRKAVGHMGELILTMGISFVIVAAIKKIWGTESLPLQMPEVLSGMVNIVGVTYPVYRLFVIGLALVILVFMLLLLYRTRLGKIVRAAVSDRDMVNALGININLVFMFVFGVGTWMAGLAGVAIAPILTVFPGLADQVGMDAFIVVVTGGFGSLLGAFIVSIIFGLLSSYGVQFVSQFAPVLMVVFMAIVLAFRPNGLFGVKE
ncbi:MAG: branched-chain amino acid ABC transporter permease [Smithellaceae bacterium]|nr:branched-chain amino acid ABC transporter permease [Syntrophaceae bacterium]MDD4239934.1 branched-chain amino acid ABC transporter permease [Smithellaceae bacterium]NLX51597.1 branched-chain amino acid ABC transporter permease [Deltaproteobacteria bacterium]